MSKRRIGIGGAVVALAAGAIVIFFVATRDRRTVLNVYCGGSMRPPMQQLIQEFEAAHPDVRIATTYSGCGILVGQMKAGQGGDVYYACDTYFMDEARSIGAIDDAYPVAVVTHFRPVIMVKKGNPKGIRTLADLGNEGVNVGLGNEQHGAVGHTGWAIARSAPNWPAVKKNIRYEAPTADMLAAQVADGALDAAIIWDVLARAYSDKSDTVEIAGRQADQPIGLMKDSANPALAKQFIEFVRSAHAQEVFRQHGFLVAGATTRAD